MQTRDKEKGIERIDERRGGGRRFQNDRPCAEAKKMKSLKLYTHSCLCATSLRHMSVDVYMHLESLNSEMPIV